jgi:hypothetical protein
MGQMLPKCLDRHLGALNDKVAALDQRVNTIQEQHQAMLNELRQTFGKRLDDLENHRGDDVKSDATTAASPQPPVRAPARRPPSDVPADPTKLEIKGWPPNTSASKMTEAWKAMLAKYDGTPMPTPVADSTQFPYGSRLDMKFNNRIDAQLFLSHYRDYVKSKPDAFSWKAPNGHMYGVYVTRGMSGLERFRNGKAKSMEYSLKAAFPMGSFTVVWGRHVILCDAESDECVELARWCAESLDYVLDTTLLRQRFGPDAATTLADMQKIQRSRLRQRPD